MRIDLKEIICGLPAGRARDFARAVHGSSWSVSDVARILQIEKEEARKLVNRLKRDGYAAKAPKTHKHGGDLTLTLKGSALAGATAARPLKRTSAETILSQFMERVARVNADPYYLYRVRAVCIFGSYLQASERLGDIDLAIELTHREDDAQRYEKASDRRRHRAHLEGVAFRSTFAEVMYPEMEVWKFLKFGSRAISLHSVSTVLQNGFPYKVLYLSDDKDYAPAIEDPDSARPLTYRRHRRLEFIAIRETKLASVTFEAGETVYLQLKEPWTPSTEQHENGDWRADDHFEGIPGTFNAAELLNLAEAAFIRVSELIYHCRLKDAHEAAKRPCPSCTQSTLFTILIGETPAVMCKNCQHKEWFDYKPIKKRALRRGT